MYFPEFHFLYLEYRFFFFLAFIVSLDSSIGSYISSFKIQGKISSCKTQTLNLEMKWKALYLLRYSGSRLLSVSTLPQTCIICTLGKPDFHLETKAWANRFLWRGIR